MQQGRRGGRGMMISGTEVSENSAVQGSGGALSVLGPDVPLLNIIDTSFSGNTAVGNGGAIDVRHVAQTKLDQVLFENNSAEGFGGALSASAVSIAMCVFSMHANQSVAVV